MTTLNEQQEEKFRESARKCCETVKELIECELDGATYKDKARILEEESEEMDNHTTLEEFLGWTDEFLPK